MNLIYKKAVEEPLGHNHDLGHENVVRVHASLFSQITGRPASENRLKPWKGRVVRLTSKEGSVYRLLRSNGTRPIPAGVIWMGRKTRTQLDLKEDDQVAVEGVWQPWGRYLYYHTHLDDTVRFAFRIGFWGLIFAIASLFLAVLPLLPKR